MDNYNSILKNLCVMEVRDFENDPTRSGRCRVRGYNMHNDEQEIKDDHLAWASVLHPITSPATYKVGISPSGLKIGSRVLCTYLPEDYGRQFPIILGSLARGDMPEGHDDDNGGVGKDSQESYKNSGGKIKKPGVDNPGYSKEDNQEKKAFKEGKRIFHNPNLKQKAATDIV